jgi:hypothetical protein
MGMERVLSRRAGAVLGLGLAALVLGGCFRAATPTPSPTRATATALLAVATPPSSPPALSRPSSNDPNLLGDGVD